MNLLTLIILILIGLAAGAFSGLVGLGGGIIMIPAMVLFLGMSQYMAQGTSLAVMLPPIGILAAYNYWKAGELNLKYALIISVTFVVGSYFGSKFALNIPQDTMRKLFAIFLVVMAINLFFKK
jgi:uncharacterized membrane protein YfcA